MSVADEQQKRARCRHIRRWRQRLCIAFLPLGFMLMVGLQIGFAGSVLLAWPVLLGYVLGVMIWLHQLDSCPWCHQSFHTSNRGSANAPLKSRLWRDRCANCGQPDPAD